jgi:hypothetical protein
MNWAHIDAVMKGTGGIVFCRSGEETLVSNGYIALVNDPAYISLVNARQFDMSKMWADHTKQVGEPATPGRLYHFLNLYARQMGTGAEMIDEAYFRCFDSPETTWFYAPISNLKHRPLQVVVGGIVIAVVMPVSMEVDGATDGDVFARFCNEVNGYYLITRKKLREQLEEVRESIDTTRDKIDEMEGELEEYETERDA